MKLRKYQQESRVAIQDEWQKGIKRTLLVLPTGCG
jgi:superfamily II DNA or RNA helicase